MALPLDPPSFVAQDCATTLRDALAEHRARVPGLISGGADPVLGALFDGHDACHVLFGLTTRLDDEARADAWTLLATTMTFRRYRAYLDHPAIRDLARQLLTPMALGRAGAALFDLPRIWRSARAMRAPWDFDAWPRWLDTPVCDIRDAYGVRLLRS
jgi:hypothetical protein